MTTTDLRRLRLAAGINLAELARRVGVSRQHMASLESGRRELSKLSLATASKLAEALGVKIEELMGSKKEKR